MAHVSHLEALDDRATEGPVRVVDVDLHRGLGQAVAREPLAAHVEVDGVPTDHLGVGSPPRFALDRPQQDRPGAEVPEPNLHVALVLRAEP